MKNKIEFKKAVLLSCLVILVALIIIQLCSLYQYKTYTKNFNNKLNMIISKIENAYPDIDKNELIEILNSDENKISSIFEEYGIDLQNDSAILQNNKVFTKFSIINLCMITILFLVIILIFISYNKSKDKKLQEITRYIEEINNKNYKLDIEDNTEDELSILKNEIYKTTVMLKEVAENSVNDKINLKDSLSDISHQLKTPLTSMTIMIDNLIENPEMDKSTREDFIKDIKREIINVNFLINSLLKLSKLDANSVNFINKEVTIYEIIEEAIKNVSVLCDLKNVEILVNGDKSIKINCDLKWQVEAITNILKNCIEHSNENSKIEISFEKNNVYSQIKIKDHGIGITKEDLPHIFERFYKGKNSKSDSIGIGLALSKSIIENTNGYIKAESEAENGSLFTIKYF
jgi:signal transduction histidine kinase